MMTRRHALSCGIAAASAAALRPTRLLAAPAEFKSMTGDVKPVSRDEYLPVSYAHLTLPTILRV